MLPALLIPGQSGHLEVVLENARALTHGVGIICHPHPLHGGSMNNKVVTTTAKALQMLGLATVRFNFRGVGQSEGQYDAGLGELQDLLSVLQWLQATYAPTVYWLAGFSFGSHIAFQGSLQWPCQQLITIAPPIMRFDFLQTHQIQCPWLLIQGDQDEIVDPASVFAWARTLSIPIHVIDIPGASHFFHGKLIELREAIVTELAH